MGKEKKKKKRKMALLTFFVPYDLGNNFIYFSTFEHFYIFM